MAVTGTPWVLPRVQVFSDAGAPLAGALLYVYTAGTSTPVDTFSDVTLTTANANPVVADAGGRFGAIYLTPGVSYKFVLKTSAGATIWTADNIPALAAGTTIAQDASICHGRMTLTAGTPVTTADVTAATLVYFTPYTGNQIALYDATLSSWLLVTFAETSLSLGSDAASKPYDLFAYSNAGVFALERLVWTSTTARATALTLQDGILVKSGQPSRRYLGTYTTTATPGQTEDSKANRLVYSYYNRVIKPLQLLETTDSWTYSTATYRQARATATNQVAVTQGWAEDALSVAVAVGMSPSGGSLGTVSIGEDSTTTPVSGVLMFRDQTNAHARLTLTPAVGYHAYVWLEYDTPAADTMTWYGDNGTATLVQSGMTGSWSC